MHAIVFALALAHGSVDDDLPQLPHRANVGPASVVGVVAGGAVGFVTGLGVAFATAFVVDGGHPAAGCPVGHVCTDVELDPGEQDAIAVGFIAIPLATFAGAIAGAFIGDRIDRE